MSNKQILLNIITSLYIPYIFLGMKFLQVDVYGDDETIHSYNSMIGLAINILMWLFVLTSKKPLNKVFLYKAIGAWTFLIIIQTFITGTSVLRSFITLHYVTFWCANFLFFYTINSCYPEYKNLILKRMVFLVGVAILSYWYVFNSRLSLLGFVGDGVNISYFLVAMTPWIMLISDDKKVLRNLLLIICAISVLASVKRTAIIAFILILFVYIVFSNSRRVSFQKLFGIVAVAVFSVFAFVYIDQTFLEGSVTNRFLLFDDGMGKRDEIKVVSMSLYSQSDTFSQLVGHGYNSLIVDSPLDLSAHNDYIETLYDHGAIMLVLEILIVIGLCNYMFKFFKNGDARFGALASRVIVFGIMSYSSHMLLYPYYFIFMTALWGYIVGLTH